MLGNSTIITDGFTVNIASKTAEGTTNSEQKLKMSLTKILTNFLNFSYFALKNLKINLILENIMDKFLGLNGPVVKVMEVLDSIVYHSIDLCYKIVKGNLMKKLKIIYRI